MNSYYENIGWKHHAGIRMQLFIVDCFGNYVDDADLCAAAILAAYWFAGNREINAGFYGVGF